MTQKCESLQSRYDEMEATRQAEIAELRIGMERLETEIQTFQQDRETLSTEKGSLEERLVEIQGEKDELALKYQECMTKIQALELKTEHYAKEEASLQQSVSATTQRTEGKFSFRGCVMWCIRFYLWKYRSLAQNINFTNVFCYIVTLHALLT